MIQLTKQQKTLLVLASILAVLAFSAIGLRNALSLRITGTDPALNAVPSFTQHINLYFNKPLDTTGVIINYPDLPVVKQSVTDNKIDLQISSSGIKINQTYTITIVSLRAKSGQKISNKVLTFTARNIPFESLNKGTQKSLVQNQDNYPYDIQNVGFTGFDALKNNGLDSSQIEDLQSYIFAYSKTVSKQFWHVTIPAKTINAKIHTADSADTNDYIDFDIQAEGTALHVYLVSDPFGGNLTFRFTDTTGKTVFDNAAYTATQDNFAE